MVGIIVIATANHFRDGLVGMALSGAGAAIVSLFTHLENVNANTPQGELTALAGYAVPFQSTSLWY